MEQQNLFLSLASRASMFDFFWTFLTIFKSISEAQLKHLICKFEVFEKKKCSWQKGYKKAKILRTSGEYLNNGAVLWVFVNVADTFIQSPADYASIYHQRRQTTIHSLLQTQAHESKHQTATLELFGFARVWNNSVIPPYGSSLEIILPPTARFTVIELKLLSMTGETASFFVRLRTKETHTHTHTKKKKNAATVQRMKTGFSPTKSWWDCMLWP